MFYLVPGTAQFDQLTARLTSIRQLIFGQSFSKGQLRTPHYRALDFHFKVKEDPVEWIDVGQFPLFPSLRIFLFLSELEPVPSIVWTQRCTDMKECYCCPNKVFHLQRRSEPRMGSPFRPSPVTQGRSSPRIDFRVAACEISRSTTWYLRQCLWENATLHT